MWRSNFKFKIRIIVERQIPFNPELREVTSLTAFSIFINLVLTVLLATISYDDGISAIPSAKPITAPGLFQWIPSDLIEKYYLKLQCMHV